MRNAGNYSDCIEKALKVCLSLYLIVIIGLPANIIAQFLEVDLIYRDFDKCIIPNLKKDYKFSKFKEFIMEAHPIVMSIIILLEIIDIFTTFCKICCSTDID